MHRAFADPVAIIDIGSNSARLVVYQREVGQLRILGSARQALRLVREVDRGHQLSAEAMESTLRALADFRSVTRAYGAGHVIAIATAAMRDAGNGRELIERARAELGIRIEVIDSNKEAHYGCVGGIRALPVDDGIVLSVAWRIPALRSGLAVAEGCPESAVRLRRYVRRPRVSTPPPFMKSIRPNAFRKCHECSTATKI